MESSGRAERAVARINLEQCRKQAKELVKAFARGDARALDTIRWNHPRFRGKSDAEILAQPFVLADAQLVIARTQHIESWPKLLEYLDALDTTDSGVHVFERAIDAVVSGDVEALRALLRAAPSLVRQRSTRAHASTLLHYVSANGVENHRQVTPPNIVDVTRVLLDAGAAVDAESGAYGGGSTTLGLTATSAHPRLAGVQIALMDLLIDRGAVIGPLGTREGMVRAAVANGCPEAAAHLLARGATLDDLVGAAALGRADIVATQLGAASAAQRDSALLIAAQADHAGVVKLLLDRGADVAAYDGMTALHWAAANGNVTLVQWLVARGAPLEAKNEYGGTVLDSTLWFVHHALETDATRRDFVGVLDALIAAGARSDVYPTMRDEIDAVRQRAGRARPDESNSTG